jgi:hypothetical protein
LLAEPRARRRPTGAARNSGDPVSADEGGAVVTILSQA